MTAPSLETLEREKDKLYVTDAELIRKLGVPEKLARANLAVLDREKRHGFPPKLKQWGDRRYWPAVKAFLDQTGGLTMVPSQGRKDHG